MKRPGILVGALLAVLVGAAACSSSSPGDGDAGPGPSEDGGDASDGGDGGDGPASAGLGLAFASDPSLPGDVGGEFDGILNGAHIELERVRAVGDAAPGDARTTEPFLLLEWGGDGDGGGDDDDGEGEGDGDAITVFFATAPPGLYSHVLADITSYRLTGTVIVGGTTSPFVIEEAPPTPLSISIDLSGFELPAGGNQTVAIRVRLRDAAREPSWNQVAPDNTGVRRIGPGSDQLGLVRENLRDGFDDDGGEDD